MSTAKEKEIKLNEGGIWEESEFSIELDGKLEEWNHQCRHVKDGKLKAIVIAGNEGGYNSTGVCLECIIEAARTHELLALAAPIPGQGATAYLDNLQQRIGLMIEDTLAEVQGGGCGKPSVQDLERCGKYHKLLAELP